MAQKRDWIRASLEEGLGKGGGRCLTLSLFYFTVEGYNIHIQENT